MANVALIYFDLNSGYLGFSHAMAYLAGMLKKYNQKVTFFHITNEQQFVNAFNTINQINPDILGFSFTTNQIKYVTKFIKLGRPLAKLIIAGGTHISSTKEEAFSQFPIFDGLCIGEGEFAFKELCARIDSKKDYSSTPSFYFRNKEGIIKNPIMPLMDIEDLALPDYSIFDVKKVVEGSDGAFTMMISRGCPYSCSYCCNHLYRELYPNKAKYIRIPSVDYALEIIKHNLSFYPNSKSIYFADDTFTLKKQFLLDFCKQYKAQIDLPFSCNARIETIDEEVVSALKNAGCTLLTFGIESGNEWMRKNILNRYYTNKQIKDVFKQVKKSGIKTHTFNIFGLPFETARMAEDTIKLNFEIQPNSGRCFYFFPYPYTQDYELCKKYNLIDETSIASLSGYLEAPSLKEIYLTHKEIRGFVNKLQIYFYSRVFLFKIGTPNFLQNPLIEVILFFRLPISLFLKSENGLVKKIRSLMG